MASGNIRGGSAGSRQKSLVDIAANFHKSISDAKADDRVDEVDGFHAAIRKELLQGVTTEDDIIEIFEKKNENYARLFLEAGNGARNMFHVIIERLNRKPSSRMEDQNKMNTVRRFLQHLVITYPEVLEQRDDGDLTPLERAAKKNKSIVFLIVDLVVPKNTMDSLQRKCEKTTKPDSSASSKQDVTANCEIKLSETLVRRFCKPGDINTNKCLHQRLNEKKLAESDKNLRRALSEVLLGKGEDDSNGNRVTCLHSLLEDDSPFTMVNAEKSIEIFKRFIELCPKSLINVYSPDGFTPLHKAIQLYKSESFNFELLNAVINKLLQRAPESLYSKVQGYPTSANYDKSPYRLLQGLRPDPNPNTRSNKMKCHEEIQQVLKYSCIGGTRRRGEKLEYLYGESEDAPKLFLDLAHVSGGVNKRYLEMLSQKVNQSFDTALEYVKLPQIQQPAQPLSSTGGETSLNSVLGDSPMPQDERDPYSQIFLWLYNKRVRKIFKVTVDDLEEKAHSDEAILTALKPFEVEVWDWRKFDMCSDTIQRAAPYVRHVFLHASGNNAILRSWSCPRGLAKLEHVETITITMYPEKRESRETLKMYLKDFKENMTLNRPDIRPENIIIKGLDEPLKPEILPERSIGSANAVQQSEDAWITNLTPFQKSLDSWFDNEEDRPSVKIALIDNGVNIRHRLVGNITMGESFYGSSEGQSGFREYFADPSAHGTQMAICIRKVCPMAKLYVARLDDSKGQLTVSSAIQALEWATKKGVDIISMSWTFNQKKHPDNQETADFKNKIEEASRKALLFASLNDAEPTSDVSEFYPVGLADVFKIGSAKKWGANADFQQEGKSDYLFPGQEVELEDPDGETMHPSGSSLATAFAAGMAGLIIYSMEVHLKTSDGDKDVKERRLAEAKTRPGMTRVFDILGENKSRAQKDVPVAFRKKFPETIGQLEGQKIDSLREFLSSVAPIYNT